MRFNLTISQLKQSERSVYSQGGQDGVLEAIFNQIDRGAKTFVEFGARDGVDCSNTANLRLYHGWSGLLMDAEPLADFVKKANINKNNINALLISYCKSSIDYMSIDVDGNDYWIWEALELMPTVLSIEYNPKFTNDVSCAIEYNPDHIWAGDDYYGASLLALKKLGERKGYTLVYVVDRLDAIFIRNDFIDENYQPPTLDELLPQPIICFDKVSDKKWIQV